MNLTKEELQLVDTIENNLKNAINEKTEGMQKQLDVIFTKFETSRPASMNFKSSVERKEANDWLKKFFKKELQTKESGLTSVEFMATDPDSAGGVLVPDLLLAEIQHCAGEYGVARNKMRYLPVSGAGNSRRIPKEIGSIIVQWVDEGAKKPISNLVLDEVVLQLKKLAVISIMTDELIEDSAMDLVNFVARRIATAISEEEDRVFFAGDVTLGDPFNGIINTANVVNVFLGTDEVATDITADDLLNMIYAIPKSGRRGAEFYFHSDIMHYIQRLRIDVIADGDGLGGYLVQPATLGAPASIWGYPVNIVDELPDGTTAIPEAPFAIFGNLQRTCFYADKNSLRIKLLDQATIEDALGNQLHLAQADAQALRVFKRVGYVCTLPECLAVLNTGPAPLG